MTREGEFPTVERHTEQSWRERFKKNAVAFERRLKRFIADGINDKLLTVEERKREKERKAKRTAEALTQGEASGSTPQRPGAAAPTSSSKGKERAAPPSAKRKLALLSDDDGNEHATSPDKNRPKGSQAQPIGRTARLEALGPAPVVTTEPTALTGTAAAGSSRQAGATEDEQSGTHVSFEPDFDILPAPGAIQKQVIVDVVEATIGEGAVVEAASVSVAVTQTAVETGQVQPVPERAPTPRTSTPIPRIPITANSPRTPLHPEERRRQRAPLRLSLLQRAALLSPCPTPLHLSYRPRPDL